MQGLRSSNQDYPAFSKAANPLAATNMTAIPIERIKYEIVSAANEDITGLYEVIWALNSLYPAITKAEKINYSKPAITELLQKGIVDLYRRNWDTRVAEGIKKEKALEIVKNDESWEAPSGETNGEYYCFLATGEKTLEEENKLYLQINGG